jgi:hypothetical protein
MTLTELFTNIANAIRAKTGSTEPIIAEDFPSAIEAISGGSSEISMITTTISEEDAQWASELIIPELIGAKYFIIQGNPLTAQREAQTNYTDDAATIRQLIYLNGLIIVSFYARGAVNVNFCNTTTEIYTNDPSKFSFDETTGTIITYYTFNKISSDPSTTGIAYTVYRIG